MGAVPHVPLSTRDALLAAAARCFAQQGYRSATVQTIAKEAGFTPPTVYAHFGSKQGLFEALVQELLEDLWATLGRELPEGLRLNQRLELRVGELLEMAARRRALFTLFILRPYDLPDLTGHDDDDLALERHWQTLFEQHVDELGDRTPREAALVMEGVMHAFVKAWVRSEEHAEAPNTRRIVALVLGGIRAGGG